MFNVVIQTDKKIHLFDTFTGMPAPSKEDYKGDITYPGTLKGEGGEFGKNSLCDTSEQIVYSLFDKFNMDLQRVRINKVFLGDTPWYIKCFNKALQVIGYVVNKKLPIEKDILSLFPKQISFLHVDVDFYKPIKWVLDNLYKHIPHGGVIVFDDYGYWIGAKRAVDEFIQKSGEVLYETNGTTQRYVVKRQRVFVDLDDFCEEYMTEREWNLLHELRRIYPDFKVTMFTIPAKSSPQWLRWVKKQYPWIEMAIHGTYHENQDEWIVSGKKAKEMLDKILWIYNDEVFCRGFKAPWWKISYDMYNVLRKNGFWVALNKTNKFIKGEPQLTYIYDCGDEVLPDIHYRNSFFDTWHGHVQSQKEFGAKIPNGLEDIFDLISKTWHHQARFSFVSELFNKPQNA